MNLLFVSDILARRNLILIFYNAVFIDHSFLLIKYTYFRSTFSHAQFSSSSKETHTLCF